MMQIGEYFRAYDAFYAEFFPESTVDEVIKKFSSEMHEAQVEIDALWAGLGSDQDFIDETIDVMNLAMKTLRANGVKDPLQAGADKLKLTSEKYHNEWGLKK